MVVFVASAAKAVVGVVVMVVVMVVGCVCGSYQDKSQCKTLI